MIKSDNSQKYQWLYKQVSIFILFFIIACIDYNFYFTNDFTPGGDGSRIYPYLKYLKKVPEILPFWQAHKNYGYPLLADVENHMFWSLALNTESKYFNFQLNLLFFCLTTVFAYSCRGIARTLGLSQLSSFLVGVITIICVPVARVFMHGTITSFFCYVLIFFAIWLLMIAISKQNSHALYMILLTAIFLAWCLATKGYYFLISPYIPAFFFILAFYLKSKETFTNSIKRTIYILIIVTFLLIPFSMPLLLPILDGIILSNTFSTETPTIIIQEKDIYNYYLNLWPFILLAVIFSKGIFKKYSYLFLTMAIINYALILFKTIHFDTFFELWTSTPILKNIRWQHSFRELSSISAAFCAGIFIDSCWGKQKKEYRKIFHISIILGFSLLLLLVANKQRILGLPDYMIAISIIFIALAFAANNKNVVLSLCIVMLVVMIINFKQSPFGNKLYTATNQETFKEYNSRYYWYNGIYGRDKFTPIFSYGSFSMVFMNGYRTLLSLLYRKEITAQRPHWVWRIDKVDRNQQNPQMARLMGMDNKGFKNWEFPFRIYDEWVVNDDSQTVKKMKKPNFTPNDPIILSDNPKLEQEKNIPLKAKIKLTGKTADTLSLLVDTNKNCVVLIPEIYHRDWYAKIDDKETQVLKAFASMRAVAVPPGKHKIAMKFIYWPFWFGLAIASISFFVSFLIFFRFKDEIYGFIAKKCTQ